MSWGMKGSPYFGKHIGVSQDCSWALARVGSRLPVWELSSQNSKVHTWSWKLGETTAQKPMANSHEGHYANGPGALKNGQKGNTMIPRVLQSLQR